MRIAIIGSSGAGKSTLARRLGAAVEAPVIELDAINWQADWIDLNTHAPEEFIRRVEAAVAAERWVSDGNYSLVQPLIMARATHLVWLDYSRAVVMSRVLRRSFARAWTGRELWPGTGNRETWRRWMDKDHPIRWAWDTFDSRRARYAAMFDDPAVAGVEQFRLRRPAAADRVLRRLKEQASL